MYHRYIKLPVSHKKPMCFDTQPTEPTVIFVNKEYIDYSVVKCIESFGVIISNVTEGIYTPPNHKKLHIHNDTNTITNATKINFTWGPSNSVTRWWKVKDKMSLKIDVTDSTHILQSVDPDIVGSFDAQKNHSELYCEDENLCDLVCERVIDRPSLMNVGQLHSTYNPHATEGRWTLCFFLLKSDYTHLQFDEAVEIFKDIAHE